MISRRTTERTTRTSRSRRVPVRRGLQNRGALPSFGDMILPVVSIAAVILLALTGWQFFVRGMQKPPEISSTQAFADAPSLAAERERQAEAQAEQQAALSSSLTSNDAASQDKLSVSTSNQKEQEEDILALVIAEKKEEAAPKTQASIKKTPTAQSSSNAVATKRLNENKTQSEQISNSQQWRVQVGAYRSRANAQNEAAKINRMGYNAVVYSNPASKHIKVWVYAGATKQAAEKVAASLKRLGYKGSFVFPPRAK